MIKLFYVGVCHLILIKFEPVGQNDFELFGADMEASVIDLSFVGVEVLRLLAESVSMLPIYFRNNILLFRIILNVVKETDLTLLWRSLSLNLFNRLLDLFLLLLDLLHHRGLLSNHIHDGLHLVCLLLTNSFLGRRLLHGKLNA